MILGVAIGKISDSQIICEWGDERQPNIVETRSQIKNFLREKAFLNFNSKFVDINNHTIHFITKKTCVYLAIYSKTSNFGHIKECLKDVQEEFEKVTTLDITHKKYLNKTQN